MLYPYVIVSAERTEFSHDENTGRLAMAGAIAQAAGVAYVTVSGAYDGTPEHSLALQGEGALSTAQLIGKVFSQHSILIVEAADRAILQTPTGTILAIFTQRIEATADNYTRIGDDTFSFAA